MRERHKTGSLVFDRARGTWRFLQWVNGKRKSVTIGTKREFPTKGAALRATEGLRIAPEKLIHGDTVKALAARYEAERLPSRRSTARVYRSWLHKHVLPQWGNSPISDVKPLPVEQWLRGLKLSPKSKSHVRNMLHLLMDFAMLCGVMEIARNPIDLVRVKRATKRISKPRSLTVAEFQTLSEHLKEPFRTIAFVCVCFGLRISECLALKWCDVDWLSSTLRIERGIVEQNVDDVKTEDSRRTLTVANELLDVLKVWKQTTRFSDDGDWIFASPLKIGRLPYSYTGVWRELQRAAGAAGIGGLGTHSFRHTYRTWLDSVGTTVGVQQKLMRHSDIRTTMNIYGDAASADMREANDKVVKLAFSA
jgi:integrase